MIPAGIKELDHPQQFRQTYQSIVILIHREETIFTFHNAFGMPFCDAFFLPFFDTAFSGDTFFFAFHDA